MPPIEGFDFKPWIAEMGNEALPYQTTIFPIQMNGWSYDYTLALDDDNCAKRKAVRESHRAELDKQVQDAVAASQLDDSIKSQYLSNDKWESFCDYTRWAYIESVELDNNLQDKTNDICNTLFAKRAQHHANLEQSQLKNVSSSALTQHMNAQLQKWIQQFNDGGKKSSGPKETQLLDTTQEKRPKQGGGKISLEGTAGSENPNYVMFWTNEQMLELIASRISSKDLLDQKLTPFKPSSTVLLELTREKASVVSLTYDLYVQLYINDQPVKTDLCPGGASKCTAAQFVAGLSKDLDSMVVSDFCKS